MNKSLILALDIGTSSVRAELYDSEANVLPETMVRNKWQLHSTVDGGAEIDVEIALKQVISAIDQGLEKGAQIDGEISHVSASSFWHS
ncbi:MAG: carbohydrate kinase, partial [Acidobacteria bacterium]|nr:carbohydrate kinase [Acidobacteriota bacterium]